MEMQTCETNALRGIHLRVLLISFHLLHESSRNCMQYFEKIRKVPIVKLYI